MRNVRSISIAAAVLIGAMPVAVSAEANHNTTRSNQVGAAPADDVIPEESGAEQQTSGKKGYDYYKSQSEMAAQTEVTADTMPGQGVASMDKATDVGTDAEEAAPANINTSRSNTKGQ